MEPSSDRDYQDRRVGPTVSKEKWINHARTKMAKGYVLIVGKNRKSANFYLRSKGFEMCPYNVAKQLIKDGIVVESGDHHLGTMYKLAEDVVIPVVEPKRRVEIDPEEPVDDMDTMLDDISEEEPSDEPETEEEDF